MSSSSSPPPLSHQLQRAVLDGDTATVKALLEKPNTNEITPQDLTSPLNSAVTHGHVALVRLLLEHGAPITVSTNALVGAVDQPRPQEMYEAFLEHGWSVDSTTSGKNGVMVMCLAMAHPEGESLLSWFLTHGASANGLPSSPGSPLRHARTPTMIQNLLSHGATLAHTSALHTAIARYDDNSVRLPLVTCLLDAGADINELQYTGWSRDTLPRGANNKDHGTPLHVAAREDAVEVLWLLVERGADVAKQSKNGYTAIEWASLFRRDGVWSYLYEVMREKGLEVREFHRNEEETEEEYDNRTRRED